ncbi:MAG TPA: Rrf2 family transcriptional regulator [Caldithrix abyssi]|uniref:Rrf2 family transcriptional regulator n=1 Tax=Caldithrix abyssi TaxID=187145 RepID=A0A7V1LYV7_CALAY|nr:Rrf2 family transcriptional regulator [Caldithrix abyssi]
MLFSLKKEYDHAIRICGFLAGHYGDSRPIPVRELAERLLVSKPFATKIVYQLRLGGLLASEQGKYGGIRLRLSPRDITLYDILKAMGMGRMISECVLEEDFCPLPAPCKIHGFFMEQEASLVKVFKNRKLAEFAFTEKDFKTSSPQ